MPCLSVPRALRCSPSGVPAKLPTRSPASSLGGRELPFTACLTSLEAGWLRNSWGQGQPVLMAPVRLRAAVPPLAWQATPELLAESGATRTRPPLTLGPPLGCALRLLAGRNALASSGNALTCPQPACLHHVSRVLEQAGTGISPASCMAAPARRTMQPRSQRSFGVTHPHFHHYFHFSSFATCRTVLA